ncbi:MAG TPA: SDR family NAD(P)-dependent oxidoreductase, partial [Pseudomonadales bacterium]
MSDKKKAIVIGVGPEAGLGARLAERFASLGLHVFVAGRTREQLDHVVRSITTNDGNATAVVTDATDESAVIALFDAAEAAPGGPIDLAIYNAGNNTPGRIVEMDAAYFERAWRVGCFGGFLFGREAVRRMLPHKRGTLLFTGASASMRGRANFGA